MASIGDLFFAAHLQDQGLQVEAAKAGDKAGQTLGSRLSQKLSQGLAGTRNGLVQGLGIGAGVTAFGLLDSAATRAVDALKAIVGAGIAEEESMSRLTTALRANVVGWNGNTDSIVATIKAHVALGFTQEEQRNSLTQLVAATHDVNKAFEVQAVAMDLARFKHISLAEASDALTKVEAGSYRILKSLGIELKHGATQTEALAAVEKIAAGQAEEFAKTTEGKLTVAQAKLGAVMEDLGVRILPLVSTAADVVVAAIDQVVPTIDAIVAAANTAGDILNKLTDASDSTGVSFRATAREADPLGKALAFLWNGELKLLGITPAVGAAMTEMGTHAGKLADDLGTVPSKFYETGLAAAALARAIAKAAADIKPIKIKGLFGSDLAAQSSYAIAWAHRVGNLAGGALADSIRKRRAVVDQAWMDLLDAIKNAQKPAAERAHLLGELTSKELIKGLHSQDPMVRDQAAYTKQVIIDRLTQLGTTTRNIGKVGMDELRLAMKSKDPDIRAAAKSIYNAATQPIKPVVAAMTAYGRNAALNFARGLESGAQRVRDAALALAQYVAGHLRTASPAKMGPLSTLGGPEGWGVRAGALFSKGLASALPDMSGLGQQAFATPGTAPAAPSYAASAVPAAGASQAASGGNTYNVHVEGLLKARTAGEIGDNLRRLADFGVLP